MQISGTYSERMHHFLYSFKQTATFAEEGNFISNVFKYSPNQRMERRMDSNSNRSGSGISWINNNNNNENDTLCMKNSAICPVVRKKGEKRWRKRNKKRFKLIEKARGISGNHH